MGTGKVGSCVEEGLGVESQYFSYYFLENKKRGIAPLV